MTHHQAARILVVDDSDGARATIRRAIERSGLNVEVVEAKDGSQGLSIALNGSVDVVLSDVVMPTLDGIKLLRAIRNVYDPEELPVILVTTLSDLETRAAGYEAGVSDYLCKPFSEIEIVSRVRVQLRLRQLRREVLAAQDRVEVEEPRDDLTGLGTRRTVLEAASLEFERVMRARSRPDMVSFIMLSIDLPRGVRHPGGAGIAAPAIAEAAAVMQRCLRAGDQLARLHAHRFAALLADTDTGSVAVIGQRVLRSIRQARFTGSPDGRMTVSIGVATAPHEDFHNTDDLVNGAAIALDRALAAGGDRMMSYSEVRVTSAAQIH